MTLRQAVPDPPTDSRTLYTATVANRLAGLGNPK